MAECRYKGLCRLDYDIDFDVCYPCVGDGSETCFHYEPMPNVRALTGLADDIDSMERVVSHNEVRVSDEVLVSITSRIREALGASDG